MSKVQIMKVCYVTHASNLTGASQSLLDILRGIKDSNVDPIVLIGRHGPLTDELKKLGVPYRYIPYVHDIRNNNPIKNLIKRAVNRLAIWRVKRFFKKEHFDLVHNNSYLVRIGMDAAYQVKIPYICHIREMVWEGFHARLLSPKRQEFLLRNSRCAIAISDAVLQKYRPIAPNTNFRVLKDGIDINRYYHVHREILQDTTIRLLLAGRIEPTKGQLVAIQAIEQLNNKKGVDYHLTIVGNVGNPRYYSAIREYAESKNLSSLIKFIDFTDLNDLRQKSDIALVCSAAEGLGRVTVEGMLTGCLVIGAASGATPELITNGETGLLFEPENSVDLATKIHYATTHPAEMNTIAKQGQSYAKNNFDITAYCARLINIYHEILTS